jgi:Zn-dependent protease with chaperone function
MTRGVLLTLLIFASVLLVGRPACASASFVDKRVTALSEKLLLTASPRTLLDERRQLVSARFTAWTRPLYFAWAFSMIATSFYLWTSGRAARLREFLKKFLRSSLLLRFFYGCALAVCIGCSGLFTAFIRYRVAVLYELTRQTPAAWLHDQLVTIALDAGIAGLVVVFILTLVSRTRLWYVYTGLGVVIFSFAINYVEPVMIAPLYNTYHALPAKMPLAERLTVLEHRAGLDGTPIYVDDRSKQTAVINANVAGYGAMRRIVLGDNMLEDATPSEILFIVAHEMGHSVRHDVFRLTLVGTLLLLLTGSLAVLIGDHVRFRRDDDPLSRLALLTGLLGVMGLLAFPLFNAYSRSLEARADAFGLALSGQKSGAVRAFVRFADEGLAPYCPSRIVRWYFYDHPAIGTRIAAVLGRPDPCP